MAEVILDQIEERELIPGFRVRFVHGERLTMAYWSIEAGAELREHTHEHEQITNVIEGEFEMTIEGDSYRYSSGMVAVIPSNAVHRGKAITDCRVIDVFCPVREDYKI